MEPTKKLYENDSYKKEFTARVLDCRENGENWLILLDATGFFPEGGGQGADRGILRPLTQSTPEHTDHKLSDHTYQGEVQVLDVHIRDGLIQHTCNGPLKPGSPVKGILDWKLRYSNMQQHTGEHIVSGIAHRTFGVNNVGFHLGSQVVTLDFDQFLTEEQVDWLEEAANQAVWANHPVEISYPDAFQLQNLDYRSKIEIEDQVRIVTIQDVDICACCAPHVNHTGEIGLIKVINHQKYKGGIRLSILCGDRALQEVRHNQRQISQISALLSVKPESAAQGVEHLHREYQDAKYRGIQLQTERVLDLIRYLPPEQENVCLFVPELDVPAMRRAVNAMQENHSGYCGIFVGNDEAGYRYQIVSKTQDSRLAGQLLKQHFICRGGGKADMIQGQITGTKEEIQKVFSSLEI